MGPESLWYQGLGKMRQNPDLGVINGPSVVLCGQKE